MAKIIVLGAGLVGGVMAKDLSKTHKVTSVDISQKNLNKLEGIDKICADIIRAEELKDQQKEKIKIVLKNVGEQCKVAHYDVISVHNDESITRTNKDASIIWNVCAGNITVDDLEAYLRIFPDKTSSDATTYRKLLCVYDLKKFGSQAEAEDQDLNIG